jgi:hypothetical protein
MRSVRSEMSKCSVSMKCDEVWNVKYVSEECENVKWSMKCKCENVSVKV